MIETIRSAISELRQAREEAAQNYSDSCSTVWVEELIEDVDPEGKLFSYPGEAPRVKDDGDARFKDLAQRLEVQIAQLEAIVEHFKYFDIDEDPEDYGEPY